MTSLVAGGLVFLTSAAVLVIEILAVRLLAPYTGVTLETYTAIIGTVLSGIAAGTWVGGYLADRVEPRNTLGPMLVGGGVLSLTTVPLVRLLGGYVSSGGTGPVMVLSIVTFLPPAAVLSAIAPTVVKWQLRDLDATGRVVGRLSALGTAGAVVGTFLAGFVLVERARTTTSILVIGGLLVATGVALWAWLGTTDGRAMATVALLALLGAGLGSATGDPCDTETRYHCVRILADDRRPGGRILVLDNLRHSYVDLDDPTHLEFRYTKVFSDVVDAAAPTGPLATVHIGGGGFTLPRYLSAVRPGSANLVLEIDPGLVAISRERLGLRTGRDIRVRTGDARQLLKSVPRAGFDVALGDAFGGVAVPWHLTTIEFAREVRASLRPNGIYVLNIIDRPPMRFAHAEVTTLLKVFDHVGVVAPRALVEAEDGGNLVLVASDHPVDAGGIAARIADRQGEELVLADRAAAAFAHGAPVLTDDHAPVDQWLARARRS